MASPRPEPPFDFAYWLCTRSTVCQKCAARFDALRAMIDKERPPTDMRDLKRIPGGFDPATVPAGLVDLVCRAGDSPDLMTLEAEIKRLSKAVEVFQTVVKG